MKGLFRITLVTTAATVLLIFIGGLVRVSGSGLGCPDWPRCYGGWRPPISQIELQQATLPDGVMPQDVNLTLTWIEYVNRLFGVGVGILMILTVIAAWRERKKAPALLPTSITCLVLTIINGGLGAMVVKTELLPIMVSAHLLLALIIVSLLVYMLFRVAAGAAVPLLPTGGWSKLRKGLAIVWCMLIVQFLLGAGLREGLEHLLDTYPLMGGLVRLQHVGAIWPIHAVFGIVTVGALFAVVQTASGINGMSKVLVRGLWIILMLAGFQAVAGFSFSRIGLNPLVQVFHLWMASMIVIGVFFLYLCAALTVPDPVIKNAVTGRSLALFIAANLFVGGIAAAVVSAAESSRQLPTLHEIPNFSFQDQNGNPFTRKNMNGRFHVIDLIFTNCPELCPRMSGHMKTLYDRYSNDDGVHFLSLSVDPDRDTQDVLAAYAEAKGVRDDRWRFLYGNLEDVKTFAKDGLLLGSEGFPEAHSVKFVLVDPNGQIRGFYNGLLERDVHRLERDLEALAQATNR